MPAAMPRPCGDGNTQELMASAAAAVRFLPFATLLCLSQSWLSNGNTAQPSIHTSLAGHPVRAACHTTYAPPEQSWLDDKAINKDAPWEVDDMLRIMEQPFFMAKLIRLMTYSAAKDRPHNDISLCSPLSLPRWDALMTQCGTWPGTLSGALYVPLTITEDKMFKIPDAHVVLHPSLQDPFPSVDHLTGYIGGLQRSIAKHGRCALLLSLYVEVLPSNYYQPSVNVFYQFPVNAMRNRAMLQAPTDMVILADSDMVPGPSGMLPELFDNESDIRKQLNAIVDQQPGVLPHLSPAGKNLEELGVNMQIVMNLHNKEETVQLFHDGRLVQYQAENHQRTDVDRWLSSDEPYNIGSYGCRDVLRKDWYEPFMIGFKRHFPLWDERFRGYHGDKNILMASLVAAAPLDLPVVPSLFLVHAPHAGPGASADFAHWGNAFVGMKMEISKEPCVENGTALPFVMLDPEWEVELETGDLQCSFEDPLGGAMQVERPRDRLHRVRIKHRSLLASKA